jgi:hypothetical protein
VAPQLASFGFIVPEGIRVLPSKLARKSRYLNKKILQQADTAAASVEAGGVVSDEEFNELKRLAEIREIQDAAIRRTRQRRWPMLVAVVSTGVVMSILLFRHVNETEIELNAKVSELTFTSPVQQPLLSNLPVSSIVVSGLKEVTIPEPDSINEERLASVEQQSLSARLVVIDKATRRGKITILSLTIPAHTRVSLATTSIPSQLLLTFALPGSETLTFQAAVDGGIKFQVQGKQKSFDKNSQYGRPRLVTFQTESSQLALEFAPANNAADTFPSALAVEELALVSVHEHVDESSLLPRRVSSISSGNVYLQALNGKEIALKASGNLEFSKSRGTFRTITAPSSGPGFSRGQGNSMSWNTGNGQIELGFSGNVQGMTTGSRDSSRSLMPTYLEWLAARQGLVLLWGAIVYILGTITVVLRWLRVEE